LPEHIKPANTIASPQGPTIAKNHMCVACTGKVSWFDILQLPCGHGYCSGCVTFLFEDSFKNEASFPPKCCSSRIAVENPELPLFVRQSLIERCPLRKLELVNTNRTYCCKGDCNAFIPPTNISVRAQAFCEKCKTFTCATCKEAAHVDKCVPPDEEPLKKLAEKEGWRQRFHRERMISSTGGCNHMT
jgi:hypothetical protein